MDKRRLTLHNTTVENVFLYLYEQLKQINYQTIEYSRSVYFSDGTTREVTYRWCIQAVRPPKNNRIELNASYIIEPEGKPAEGYPNMGPVIIFFGFQLQTDSVLLKVEYENLFEEYVLKYINDLKNTFEHESTDTVEPEVRQGGTADKAAKESRINAMFRREEIFVEGIPLASGVLPQLISDDLSVTFRNKGTLPIHSATIVMMPYQARGAAGFIDYYSPSTDAPVNMSLELTPITTDYIELRGFAAMDIPRAVSIEGQIIFAEIADRISEKFGSHPNEDFEHNKRTDEKDLIRPNLTRVQINNLLKVFLDNLDNLPYPIRHINPAKIEVDGYDDYELTAELHKEPARCQFGRLRITDNYVETHCYFPQFNWTKEFFASLKEFLVSKNKDDKKGGTKRSPTTRTQLRYDVFSRLKDENPTWSQAKVAMEAAIELGESVTQDTVRNTYRQMGEIWERGDRIR